MCFFIYLIISYSYIAFYYTPSISAQHGVWFRGTDLLCFRLLPDVISLGNYCCFFYLTKTVCWCLGPFQCT